MTKVRLADDGVIPHLFFVWQELWSASLQGCVKLFPGSVEVKQTFRNFQKLFTKEKLYYIMNSLKQFSEPVQKVG